MIEINTPKDIVEELNIPNEHRTTFIRALVDISLDFYKVFKAYGYAINSHPRNFTEFQDNLDNVIEDSQGELSLYNEDVDFTDLKFEGNTPNIPYSLDEVVISVSADMKKIAYISNYIMFAVYGIDGFIEEYNRIDVLYTLSKYMPGLSYESILTQIGMNSNKELYSKYTI